VKKGQKEFYLKNEAALDEFVIQSGTEDLKVIEGGGQIIEGPRLRELALKTVRYKKVFSKLKRRGDSRVLDAVIRQTGIVTSTLCHEEKIAESSPKHKPILNRATPKFSR